VLYEAADAGAIRYDDETSSIGFASPLVAACIFQQRDVPDLPAWFDYQLRLTLRYPYSTLGVLAERAFRRVIADQNGLSDSEEALCRQEADASVCLLGGASLSLDTARLHVFHESPDPYGCDTMWFQLEGGCLTVYRCQIKLGASIMQHAEAVNVIDKLVRGAPSSEDWRNHFKGVDDVASVKVKLLLYCTRPLGREHDVREHARLNNVDLQDRASLAQTFWPASVLLWSQSCGACLHLGDRDGVYV
jgi:hypothetical protein